MILELKAKHFEGSEYVDFNSDCAMEKSYTELTGNRCSEGITELLDLTSFTYFRHEKYGNSEFKIDKLKAKSHNWDETVIRTIELNEI